MPRKRLHDWCQRWLITADEATTRAKSVFGSSSLVLAPLPLQLSDLEPRILFSATPMDMSSVPGGDEAAMVVEVACEESATEQTSLDQIAETQVSEIVVVDSAVPDLEQLLDDLSQSGKEVYVLDPDQDGLDQITEILEGRSGLQSLHIVSHADDGSINLGNSQLTSSNLSGYAGQLAAWDSALASNADILFYGCDLAGNADGQQLLDSIAALTGADVAASKDDTGHSSLGGDWDFEYTTGAIETELAFSSSIQSDWYGLLTLGAYESFDYSTGSLDGSNGGSGWATGWSRISGTSAVVNGTSLSDPTGTLPTEGWFDTTGHEFVVP